MSPVAGHWTPASLAAGHPPEASLPKQRPPAHCGSLSNVALGLVASAKTLLGSVYE